MAEENLKLKKTIKIGDDTYNITATEADKVNSKLTFKKNQLGLASDGKMIQTTVTEFDGSEPESVVIVPAAGGRFEGRITTKDVSDGVLASDGETIINYNDIKNKIVNKLLNTSSVAAWDGTKLTFTKKDSSETFNGISFVVADGTTTETEIEHFAAENSKVDNKWLTSYLFIDKNTKNAYFGTSEDDGYIRLSTSTINAELAEKATTICGTVDGTYRSYSAATIAQLLSDVSAIYSGTASVPKATDATTASKAKNLCKTDGTVLLSGEQVNTKLNNLAAAIENLEDGDTSAGKADEAVKATQDSDGKAINKNYYRSTYSTSVVNTITISNSTTAPSGAQPGDIWIKYT